MDIVEEKKNIIENITAKVSDITKKKKLSIGLEYYLKAENLRKSELFNESVKFYLSSLLIENNNFKCYIGLAMAYKHIFEYEKAIKYLNKAKKINSKSYELHFELGVLYLLCENPCAAIGEFQRAIRLDKTKISAQIQLAKAHEVLGEYDMAELVYNRIVELNPNNIDAFNNFANMYMHLEMYLKAGAIYRQIIKINPNFYHAYFAIGVCYEKLGKTVDAIRYFQKFSELKPNSINSSEIKKHLYKLKEQLQERKTDIKIVK